MRKGLALDDGFAHALECEVVARGVQDIFNRSPEKGNWWEDPITPPSINLIEEGWVNRTPAADTGPKEEGAGVETLLTKEEQQLKRRERKLAQTRFRIDGPANNDNDISSSLQWEQLKDRGSRAPHRMHTTLGVYHHPTLRNFTSSFLRTYLFSCYHYRGMRLYNGLKSILQVELKLTKRNLWRVEQCTVTWRRGRQITTPYKCA
jgi:hypothetical protein